MAQSKYNLKSPGVKRLMREAMELAEPTEEYYANPLEDNLFEWHFTVRGPPNTPFEGGYYHGRILLPTHYPMQPPNIILLTPNGRFETNKKICLSISGYHPESWQPSWSIRTALLALIAFMPSAPVGTIGSLDYTPEERKILAKKSLNWECSICGNTAKKLLTAPPIQHGLSQEESTMIQQIALKSEEETGKKVEGQKLSSNEIVDSTGDSTSDLRQRLQQQLTIDTTPNELPVEDSLLRVSRQNSNRDLWWMRVTWMLFSVIVILLLRRIFFL